MISKQKKKNVQLYWAWKLKESTIPKLMKQYNVNVYELYKIVNSLDRKYGMEDWIAKYY